MRQYLGNQTLPDVFCNVTQGGSNRLAFSTLDLLKLNQRINESLSEVFLLSDQYVSKFKWTTLKIFIGLFWEPLRLLGHGLAHSIKPVKH